MKAAILKKPGDLSIKEIPEPGCPYGGLLIKIKAAAICSADVKMIFKGHKALKYPRIPGHEITGIVAESRNLRVRKGERVQIAPGIICGKCHQCISGIENHCENIKILGFNMDGGFSEYITIPLEGITSNIINVIPQSLGLNEAALAEPVACCINAQEILSISAGFKILVIGAGPIGIIHSMLARLNGAEKVIMAECLPERLNSTVKSGADRLVDLSLGGMDDLKKAVFDEAGKYGVDAIILACQASLPLNNLIDLLAPRGKICLFSGINEGQKTFDIDVLNRLHYKEAALVGAYGCTSVQNRTALALMDSGKIHADWLITGQISLEEIYKGIEMVKSHQGLKTMINF